MNFDGAGGFTALPREMKETFRNCFDEDDFFEGDAINGISAREIIRKAKYYDYNGDKTAYIWCGDSEDGHLVFFGEKAFDKVLGLFKDFG